MSVSDQQIAALAERLAATERAEGHEGSARTWSGVAAKVGLEVFACAPFRTRLTVSSCAARYTRANTKLTGGARLNGKLNDGGACIGCKVGAAHARGESPERWADGSPVVRLRISSAGSSAAAPAPQLREVPGLLVPQHQVERVAKARAEKAKRVLAAKKPAGERRKRRDARRYEHEGLSLTLAEWCARPELEGLEPEGLRARLGRGGTIAEAIAARARGNEIRKAALVEIDGRSMSLAEWCDTPEVQALGIDRKLARNRIREKGWTPREALTTPIRRVSAPTEVVTRTFEVPAADLERMRALATESGTTVAAIMRAALRQYLDGVPSRAEAAE